MGGASSDGAPNCHGEDIPPGPCICATVTALLVQNFFVVLDRSEAMAGERWNRALETLTVFFSDPALHGVRMTLGTFPDTATPSTCNDGTCSPEGCGAPLLELARLTSDAPPADMQEYALIEALRSLAPDAAAPPLPAALHGALRGAATYRGVRRNELAHVIVVASGEPNACAETPAISLARAYSSELGIRTHVLGFDDGDVPLLDDIALAGGTEQALLLGNDPEANAADLIDLARLNPRTMSCDFPLPPSDNLDLTNVGVIMTTVNGEPIQLVQVPAPSACSDRGWYYDDPSNPTTLVLCPTSCSALSSRDYDTLEMSFACARSWLQ